MGTTRPFDQEAAKTEPAGNIALVAGASGYVGRRLVAELVASGRRVRCLARDPATLNDEQWRDRVDVVAGDLLIRESLDRVFADVARAYYLVHSIGTGGDWEERERNTARNFRDAATDAEVEQIVYLGGMGDDRRPLSAHLASRHAVGRTLAEGPVPVTELRAAVIIGSGSTSFEMMRHLVEVLPVMTTPRWVDTRVEPIAVRDVLHYLVAVLGHGEAYGKVFEIGGGEVVTYRTMMDLYAETAGLCRRLIVPVPILSPRLSSLWIGLVTPVPARVARPLVDSLVNEVVVRDRRIDQVVQHTTMRCRDAIAAAIRRVGDLRVASAQRAHPRSSPAEPTFTDPEWAGGVLLTDERVVHTQAPASALYGEICRLGGDRGWLAGNAVWSLRARVDGILGGAGGGRERRHPTDLRVGDAVDTWRVETLDRDRVVRLRSEMRLPGAAWLEWAIQSTPTGTELRQRTRFHPRGLLGRVYWYASMPFHGVTFGRMARRLAADAEGRCAREGPAPDRDGQQLDGAEGPGPSGPAVTGRRTSK